MTKTILFLFLITLSEIAYSDAYFKAQFLESKEVKKWGQVTFDSKDFTQKNPESRRPMIFDLINSKKLLGKTTSDIRTLLGTPDSYFFSDVILAYRLDNNSSKNKESFELIFVPESGTDKIKEIKVHKACCYKKPDWVN